ncbi:hypothetical protein [Kineococcus aurantiacus]|uniref:Uncharacterized protein n=1 Tax=Kineococcus aurantiacus TaxID=37633 RepID=A0A7Y9DQG0_9ACTN|nr:hypothetical protein [Kineococcus aurantiacus]NYD24858.1 hypothetical protein [Kineococcus aurantiacus]
MGRSAGPGDAGGPAGPVAVELMAALLGEAGPLATEAHRLLSPVAAFRSTLRERLLVDGQIVPFAHRAAALTPRHSIAAVDGASVREHLYAADLVVAVAVAAEGMTSVGGHPLSHRHWAHVREHESENDRLLSAAMASLELQLLADLSHDVRILDGSHGTPVIALSTALAARSRGVAGAAAELVTDEVVAAVRSLADPDQRVHPGEVVALPKADSAHAFAGVYRARYGLDLPGGDRFLAAQVLEPGEMLYPRAAAEVAGVHFTVREEAPQRVQEAASTLDQAIAPLREAAGSAQLLVTYVKPATADTVLKVEFRVSEPLVDAGAPASSRASSRALGEAQRLAGLLSAETPGPHLQEPFAQYAVDLLAKSVSVGAEALNQSMIAMLPPGSEDYLTLLARSYRTRAGGGGGGGTRPGGVGRAGGPGGPAGNR